jgi:DNA-directed RNA polymerase specialized sigma24 family protein
MAAASFRRSIESIGAIAAEQLVRLHERIVLGEVGAREELSERILPALTTELLRAMPRIEPEIVQTGVADAILAYLARPSRYDPDQASLRHYLRVVAKNKIVDSIRRSARRLQHETTDEITDRLVTSPDLEDVNSESQIEQLLRHFPSAANRDFALLKIDGERRTEVLAQVLGVAHLPKAEQQAIVHRTWVTIRTRLRRLLGRSCSVGKAS